MLFRILPLLHIVAQCSGFSSDVPDLGVLQFRTGNLGDRFNRVLKEASDIDLLKEEYEKHISDMQFVEVNGQKLVEELAAKIGKVIKKKEAALKKSVAYAEEIAADYKWNDDLRLEDADYVDAKKIEKNDSDYQYNSEFKLKINPNVSGIHIPVEIYEGGIDIQNDLKWTGGLDYIWKKNYEEDPTLLWQYFGAHTGISRTYPASRWEVSGVDMYDARRRPWYTQGASSPKDMLILVDTSGSTHGQALSLIKQSVNSILDTLNENDFVNIATFSVKAKLVGCFDSFVQAHKRNKEALSDYVATITAKGQASYVAGFKFAFEQFEKFEKRPEGAKCNRIIMFLTDGGTEMPEQLFATYNPHKEIRIFSYAVGPIANPIAAVKWIACNNRGYFYKIPAMGAIRSLVQNHVTILSRPLALSNAHVILWSSIYADSGQATVRKGLGMMTTVTLPVFNRTVASSNQTILGVMAVDMVISEMEEHIPTKQLGPNGYSFAINHNGYIVFHPNLKAKNGWLPDPPNIDFLEVEYETPEKIQLRKDMIDNNQSSANMAPTIRTFVLMADEQYADIQERTYFFAGIPGSSFSCAVVTPPYTKYYVNRTTFMDIAEGIALLNPEASEILIAPWTFCQNMVKVDNDSTPFEDFIHTLSNNFETCDSTLVQRLFHDAKVTAPMDEHWKHQIANTKRTDILDIDARFVATSGGVTRVFPAEAAHVLEDFTDTWQASYFRRAFDNDFWVFNTLHQSEVTAVDPNGTQPIVIAAHNIVLSQYDHKPAVAGAMLSQKQMREFLLQEVQNCKLNSILCYLLDDGGFVILSSDQDDAYKVGRFLGDIDPFLMNQLIKSDVFLQKEEYDYQAACPVRQSSTSAGRMSISLPIFYELLNLQWWTARLSWLFVNFNIYNWFYSAPTQAAAAAEYVVASKNYSCIKHLAQYYLPEDDSSDHKFSFNCGNCTRTVATARLPNTNLLLAMANRDCQPPGDCERPTLVHAPVESADPNFSEGHCNITRYRRRPPCYQYNANEDNSECSAAHYVGQGSVLLNLQLHLLLVLLLAALK